MRVPRWDAGRGEDDAGAAWGQDLAPARCSGTLIVTIGARGGECWKLLKSVTDQAGPDVTNKTREEGTGAMTIQWSKEWFMWSKKSKALTAGLLVAGMMATGLMLVASPAHASTTYFVNDNL